MMEGLKKIMTILALMVLLAAVSAPAMAQDSQGMQTGQQGQAQQGQAQQTGQAQEGQTATEDLMTIIENNPDLNMYEKALKASGNDQKLTGEGSFMVFAPSDQAVQRDLGVSDTSSLSSAGKYLLEGTIVENPQAPAEGSKQTTLTAINGKKIVAVKSDSQITANGVKVKTVVPATNGILVITDGVV